MDYSQLSDFEISEKIANILWPDFKVTGFMGQAVVWSSKIDNKIFAPCELAADAWKIIDKYRISLHYISKPLAGRGKIDVCIAYSFNGKGPGTHSCEHKNPFRAAMIVFLMMQDANHV